MSGLEVEPMTYCDYCGTEISKDDTIVETRIISPRQSRPIGSIVQVTHRFCWAYIDTVVKTIICTMAKFPHSPDRVDKLSEVG